MSITPNGIPLKLMNRVYYMRTLADDELSVALNELVEDFKNDEVQITYKEISHRCYVFRLNFIRTYDENQFNFKTSVTLNV